MSRIDDPSARIEYLRRAGMSDGIILNRLLIEGWDKENCLSHFAPAGAPIQVAKVLPIPQKSHYHFLMPLSTAALAVSALAALSFAGYTLYRPPVVYSVSLPEINASSTSPLSYGPLVALSDSNYYEGVKKSFSDSRASFIDANLSEMKLSVYTEGALSLQVPILAKGKVGSWWETPAGVYQIHSKKKNHFSSFGQVNQPWSLEFQGNFFIHGWPTYPDGTKVSTSYSGGCIRLSTEDAEKVYGLATEGMPVVVYNTPVAGDQFNYQLKSPSVSAKAYLVADVKNGTILSSKNASIVAPIASVSKLVSALVATEHINLDKDLYVPKEAVVYTSIPRLKAGSESRAYDLLFLLLQESSNESAEVLAASIGRARFIAKMNDKAKAINLTHTVFSDPSGAKGDYSTPQDLFTLLRYIYDNRRFIFGITSGDIVQSAYGVPAFKNIRNFNIIKNSPAKLIGGKVGQTNEASETYAGIFKVKVGSEDREIAVIVLGSQDAESDVREFLKFVNKLYAPGEVRDGMLP